VAVDSVEGEAADETTDAGGAGRRKGAKDASLDNENGASAVVHEVVTRRPKEEPFQVAGAAVADDEDVGLLALRDGAQLLFRITGQLHTAARNRRSSAHSFVFLKESTKFCAYFHELHLFPRLKAGNIADSGLWAFRENADGKTTELPSFF